MLRNVNPRSTNSHRNSGSPSESLGGIAILVVLFLVYLIVSFLGWWLLVIVPTVYCGIFFLRKHGMLRDAFSSSSNALAADKDRSLVLLHFFILTIVFTGLAVAMRGNIYSVFVASLCWLATLCVAVARMEAARATKRFVYYLAKSSMEFVTIVTATLAVCSIVALRVSMLPLNQATLLQIRSWEDHISWVHDFLKSFNPTTLQTIILIGALFAGRIFEIRHSRGNTAISRGWKATQLALKWTDRFALIALIAASFTFLATSSTGPAAPLEALLKDMEQNYSQFRSETEKAVVIETKRQLSQRAWHDMPPPLRQRMQQAQKIQKDKDSLLVEIQWADDKYHLDGTHSAKTKEEYSAQLEPQADKAQPQQTTSEGGSQSLHDDNADYTTAAQLRSAAADASNAHAEIAGKSFDTTDDMGEDLTKNVQEFVDSLDRLTDNVGPLKVITDRFPLLGELLGPINDAFNDYVYAKLKPSIHRLMRKKLAAPNKPLAMEIEKESAELARGVPLFWHRNDPGWAVELDQKLMAERSKIERVRHQLEIDVRFAEKREIQKLAEQIRGHESEYRKIAELMPEHTDLLAERERVDAELKRLERLPPDPNPLESFNRLDKPPETTTGLPISKTSLDLLTENSFRKLFESPTPFVGIRHGYSQKRATATEPKTVLGLFEDLNTRCTSRIREIVSASLYGEGRSRLLEALGRPAFDEYWKQIEFQRDGQEVSHPWDTYRRGGFPGEFGHGPRDPLLEHRFEYKVEPRFEPPRIEPPHIRFVP